MDLCIVLENELALAIHVSFNGTGKNRETAFDVAFYRSIFFKNQFTIDLNIAVNFSSNSQVRLSDDIPADLYCIANLRQFLFVFACHIFP